MKKESPVLLLGLCQTAVNAARSFARSGVNIYGLGHDQREPGFFSRFIRSYKCPDPLEAEDALVNCMLDVVKATNAVPLLIPTSDEYVFFLNRNREHFDDRALFLLPGRDTLVWLLDKKAQFEAANRSGLRVAEYYEPASKSDLKNIARNTCFPLVLKPRFSYLWKKFFNNKGFFISSENELFEKGQACMDKGLSFLVQRVIAGATQNSMEVNALFLNDLTVFAFTIQKLRQYPLKLGTATYLQNVPNEELEGSTLGFLKQHGIAGLSNTEFKRDAASGLYYFIEINVRPWLQVDICEYIGQNFLIWYYQYLTEQPLEICGRRNRKVSWMDPVDDFLSVHAARERSGRNYARWIMQLLTARSRGTFYIDDPGPFLKDVGYGLRLLNLLKKRQY